MITVAFCKVQCVGVDGVIGVATRVCQSTDVPPLEFSATRIQVQLGCKRPPHNIMVLCPIVCDEDHELGPPQVDRTFCRTCTSCNKRFHACSSGCDFVFCSVSHSCTALILASCSSRSAEQHQVIKDYRQRSSLSNRQRQDAQKPRSSRKCLVFRVALWDRRELDANPLKCFSNAIVRNVGRGLVWFRFHLESSSLCGSCDSVFFFDFNFHAVNSGRTGW